MYDKDFIDLFFFCLNRVNVLTQRHQIYNEQNIHKVKFNAIIGEEKDISSMQISPKCTHVIRK